MMSDRRPLINTGVSSRRSACDRCRTQKARCLREEADQARCDRCNRADSDCVTSPVYRMRAWQVISENPAAASTHGGRTRKRQRQQGQDTSQQLLTPAESNGAFGLQHTEEAIGTDDSVSFDHNDFAITTHSWDTQPPPGPEHCLTTGGHSTSYENIFSETMDTYAAGDLDLTNHLFAATTMPSYDAGPTLPPFGPAFAQSLTNDSPHSSDSSPDGRQASQLLQTARIDDTNSKGISPLGVEETPLQQLSRVDYHLITLLSCLGKGPPHVDMDTLVSPIDASRSSTPAVDDILNRTSDFIDILKRLSGDLAPPSSRLGRSHQDLSRHKSPCVGSDDETSMDSPMDSICSTTPSQASKPITQPASALDTGSLIAVLSTYIRVLRLHIVIFAHIEDYLKELAGSDDPVLCPVPGLSFCTFPIESGNLQTIILIQVVTSLFERMESLLGLPREFRIGARKEEPRGLFVQPGFMDIAGPIMRKEDDGQLHHGQGGVKSLRKCIKKSKQLLRDSIAP